MKPCIILYMAQQELFSPKPFYHPEKAGMSAETPKRKPKKSHYDPPATEKQMQYIRLLAEQVGASVPSAKLTLREASGVIQGLLARKERGDAPATKHSSEGSQATPQGIPA